MGWRPQIVFFVSARYFANAVCASAAVEGGRVSSAIASWSSFVIDSWIGCALLGSTDRPRRMAGVLLGARSG